MPEHPTDAHFSFTFVLKQSLAIDLEYVDRATLWNDIKLIFSTFKEIIVK